MILFAPRGRQDVKKLALPRLLSPTRILENEVFHVAQAGCPGGSVGDLETFKRLGRVFESRRSLMIWSFSRIISNNVCKGHDGKFPDRRGERTACSFSR